MQTRVFFAEVERRLGYKLDPQAEDPAVTMAGAVATYLAYRRDEVGDDPVDILTLAARAEFDGHPPDVVRDWLTERGVRV